MGSRIGILGCKMGRLGCQAIGSHSLVDEQAVDLAEGDASRGLIAIQPSAEHRTRIL